MKTLQYLLIYGLLTVAIAAATPLVQAQKIYGEEGSADATMSVDGKHVLTVDGKEELAEIDPNKDQVVARYPLTGCKGSHGLLIDAEHRLAFAACEDNSKLVVFDLETKKATATLSVGADPDVLAFDPGLQRLYVSAESGVVSIFDERDRSLQKVGEGLFGPNAHSVAVDPGTHRVYFPLQNIDGKPVLRIALPSDK